MDFNNIRINNFVPTQKVSDKQNKSLNVFPATTQTEIKDTFEKQNSSNSSNSSIKKILAGIATLATALLALFNRNKVAKLFARKAPKNDSLLTLTKPWEINKICPEINNIKTREDWNNVWGNVWNKIDFETSSFLAPEQERTLLLTAPSQISKKVAKKPIEYCLSEDGDFMPKPSLDSIRRRISLNFLNPRSTTPMNSGIIIAGKKTPQKFALIDEIAQEAAENGVNVIKIPDTQDVKQLAEALRGAFDNAEELFKTTKQNSLIVWKNADEHLYDRYLAKDPSITELIVGCTDRCNEKKGFTVLTELEGYKKDMDPAALRSGRLGSSKFLVKTTRKGTLISPSFKKSDRIRKKKYEQQEALRAQQDKDRDALIAKMHAEVEQIKTKKMGNNA